ncbi:hypothetical protein UE98_30330 [Burkholderia cenocepacia]|nr:hypothetical protein UE98_30330 [Burkholderia cenocepacia]
MISVSLEVRRVELNGLAIVRQLMSTDSTCDLLLVEFECREQMVRSRCAGAELVAHDGCRKSDCDVSPAMTICRKAQA